MDTIPRLRRVAGLGAVALGVVILWAAAAASPAHAQETIEGLEVDGHVTYELVPDGGRLQATAALQLTNTMPSRRRGIYIETPYFDKFALPAVGPVENVTARSGTGRELSVEIESVDELVDLIVVDLSPNLVHGSPQSMTVQFELPGQPNRSSSLTRVNPAFASWVAVSGGMGGHLDVTVDVPDRFAVTLSSDVPVDKSLRGDRWVYELSAGSWWDTVVVARDDDRLASETISLVGADVTVKAWPDDDAWVEFTMETLKSGLPVLERLVGQDIPDRELTVLESSGGRFEGYAGFYSPAARRIEISELLDRRTMLHELAHVWVNRTLFAERWIYEGLAEELADRAGSELGAESDTAAEIDPDAPGALPLNSWDERVVGLTDQARAEVEAFGYSASYAVIERLVAEIGMDRVRAMIAAAGDREVAYQGAPEPEGLFRTRDWQYFLDLAELVGGSERVGDLMHEHVLTADQRGRLAERKRARSELRGLREAADGWSAPYEVREEMARWHFDDAEEAIQRARSLLDRIREIRDLVAPLDVDPTNPLRTAYEHADRLDPLEETISDYEELGTQLVQLERRRVAAGPIAQLGLLHTPDGSAARAALEAGDTDMTAAQVAATRSALADARMRGLLLLIATCLLAAASGCNAWVRRRGSAVESPSGAG